MKQRSLKTFWPEKPHPSYDMEMIKKYRTLVSEKKEREIDDSTSKDLNLEAVFAKVNRTYTNPGSQVLFDSLHKPLFSVKEIEERDKKITEFSENEELRNSYIDVLSKLGQDKYSDYLNILLLDYKANKRVLLSAALSLFVFLALVISYLLNSNVRDLVFAFFSLAIGQIVTNAQRAHKSNNMISGIRGQIEVRESEGADMRSFLALTRIMDAGFRINKIKETKRLFPGFTSDIAQVKSFKDSVMAYSMAEQNPFISPILDLLFLKVFLYQNAISKLQNHKEELISFIKEVGYVDAIISMAAYRDDLKRKNIIHTKPIFTEKKAYIDIKNAIHPLVENCVPNSLKLDGEGVILTGSNMSGKSTFMRTIGINILFSQVLCISLSESYEASLFKINSTLVSSDDILEKKSYFMDEALGVLRLINSLEKDVSSFILIDEIFRGTNPIERISASSEIIDYIQDKNAVCMVATHDKDIVYLTKGKLKNYYFDEEVFDGQLKFNYILKDGIARSTNALKLMKEIGYPLEIIEGAEDIVKNQKELSDYRVLK